MATMVEVEATDARVAHVDYRAAMQALTPLHPMKREALRLIGRHGTRSPKQLAKKTRTPLANVAYHVGKLRDAGLIEVDHVEQRRGAVEHYYRLTPLARADGGR